MYVYIFSVVQLDQVEYPDTIPKIRVFTFQLNYIEKLRELCSRNSYTSEASVGTVAKSDSTEITNMSMSIWVSGQ